MSKSSSIFKLVVLPYLATCSNATTTLPVAGAIGSSSGSACVSSERFRDGRECGCGCRRGSGSGSRRVFATSSQNSAKNRNAFSTLEPTPHWDPTSSGPGPPIFLKPPEISVDQYVRRIQRDRQKRQSNPNSHHNQHEQGARVPQNLHPPYSSHKATSTSHNPSPLPILDPGPSSQSELQSFLPETRTSTTLGSVESFLSPLLHSPEHDTSHPQFSLRRQARHDASKTDGYADMYPEYGSTIQQLLATKRKERRLHVESNQPAKNLAQYDMTVKTAVNALQTVLDVHEQETRLTKGNKSKLGAKKPASPFPVIVHRLLKARQHRKAVYHIIDNPILATDVNLVSRTITLLENAGSPEAAIPLYDLLGPRNSAPNTIDPEGLLQSSSKRGPGYATLPPDPEKKYPSSWSDRRKITHYINARLSWLVHTGQYASSSSRDPLLSSLTQDGTWPKPNPSLHLLKELLIHIKKNEKKYGFKPDRVTANLILSTWIKCSQVPFPLNHQRVHPHKKSPIGYNTTNKLVSEYGPMGSSEILLIFRGVASAMKKSIQAVQLECEQHEDELSWSRHVRPFVEMFLYALRHVGDYQAQREVLAFKKEMKERVMAIHEWRGIKRSMLRAEEKGKVKSVTAKSGTEETVYKLPDTSWERGDVEGKPTVSRDKAGIKAAESEKLIVPSGNDIEKH